MLVLQCNKDKTLSIYTVVDKSGYAKCKLLFSLSASGAGLCTLAVPGTGPGSAPAPQCAAALQTRWMLRGPKVHQHQDLNATKVRNRGPVPAPLPRTVRRPRPREAGESRGVLG